MRSIDALVLDEGWFDLQVVDGKLWGFIDQSVMPQPVILKPESRDKILELESQKSIPHSEVRLLYDTITFDDLANVGT